MIPLDQVDMATGTDWSAAVLRGKDGRVLILDEVPGVLTPEIVADLRKRLDRVPPPG